MKINGETMKTETIDAKQLLIDFNSILFLEDMIYFVKENEGLGWDGPNVVAWGELCAKLNELMKS